MKIRQSPLPAHSIVAQYTADYTDCFRGEFARTETHPAGETHGRILDDDARLAGVSFQTPQPAGQAFRSKTETNGNREALKEALEKGRSLGMMTVAAKTADEMVVSLDDQAPESLSVGLYRGPEHLPQHTGAVPQQTGSRLFHPDPPVP